MPCCRTRRLLQKDDVGRLFRDIDRAVHRDAHIGRLRRGAAIDPANSRGFTRRFISVRQSQPTDSAQTGIDAPKDDGALLLSCRLECIVRLHYRGPRLSILRAVGMLWLVVCLLFGAAQAIEHQVASAFGTEVCTGEGTVMVSMGGHQLPARSPHHDDCCCANIAAIPSSIPQSSVTSQVHRVDSELPAIRLALEWLGPLSRGPPASLV